MQKIIGNKIFHKQKIYNSILWAKENIDQAPDGSIFISDIHEFTHGRQGRVWINDPEQVILTILLKPEILKNLSSHELELRLNQLNMALALGILESLKKFNIKLKWSNDFIYQDKNQDKKVAGMLIDLCWQNNKPQAIILGFAINTNNKIDLNSDLGKIATSLCQIAGQDINKQNLIQELILNLDFYYKKFLDKNFDYIFDNFKLNQAYLNKIIKIHQKDGSLISGVFHNLLPNGDLVLKINNQDIKNIPFYVIEEIKK